MVCVGQKEIEMVENLGPIAGMLLLFAIAGFIFFGYYKEWEKEGKGIGVLLACLLGPILIGLPILGCGIYLLLSLLGFDFE